LHCCTFVQADEYQFGFLFLSSSKDFQWQRYRAERTINSPPAAIPARCTPPIYALSTLSFLSMHDFIRKYFHDSDYNHNVFKAPATDRQIADIENQLDIQLPEDYKRFLNFTNGFEGFINEFLQLQLIGMTITSVTKENNS
jgi:hypothetical protein